MDTIATPRLHDLVVTWFTHRHWGEADYLLFANDHNALIDLVDGKVVLHEMPTPRHQAVVVALARALGGSRAGQVLVAPMPVRLGPGHMREPDVMFYRSEHLDRLGEQFADPPDLVVEVLSPSTRSVDLGDKLAEYAAAGIPEYWVVDPNDAAIDVFLLAGGRYARPRRFGPDTTLTPGAAPDVQLNVRAVIGRPPG
jgi:Uma2 family endonuclease